MTRKHYQRLAGLVLVYHDHFGYDGAVMIAKDFAELCREDNPRFDERKFLDACGLPDVPVSEDK